MFWRKKPAEGPLVQHRRELNEMIAALLAASGLNFDSASTLEQALVGTFAFGMMFAHGVMNKLDPPEIHALALIVYQETLHYTTDAAAKAVQECISATNPHYHDTMNAILHRGIDGHKRYISGQSEALTENIRGVLDHFRKSDG